MEQKDEVVISLKGIWGILRKNLIFIIITCLLFSLAAFFVTKFFSEKK